MSSLLDLEPDKLTGYNIIDVNKIVLISQRQVPVRHVW